MPLQRKRSWMNWDGCEPVAAWQPLYAPSYRDALWHPRVGFAGGGVDPAFSPVTGWGLNGSDQYISAPVVFQETWTAIVKFSNFTSGDNSTLFGATHGGGIASFRICPNDAGTVKYEQGNTSSVSPVATAGVLGLAGKQGYRNGLADGTPCTTAWNMAPNLPALIGCWSYWGTPIFHAACNIQAIAFYDTTLSSAQMWLRWQMMAHLDNPDWSAWGGQRQYYFSPTTAAFQAAWAERANRLIGGS